LWRRGHLPNDVSVRHGGTNPALLDHNYPMGQSGESLGIVADVDHRQTFGTHEVL
jgi:hypothetical protein